jgi:hypothetical protein
MTVIPYWLFQWTPPNLTEAERLLVGREISRVGSSAVVRCFKQHTWDAMRPGESNGFTLRDVLRDAEPYRDPNYRRQREKPTMRQMVFAIVFLGGCFAILIGSGLIAIFLIALALVGPVTFGSMYWTFRKFERWVASVIDEYAHAMTTGPKE